MRIDVYPKLLSNEKRFFYIFSISAFYAILKTDGLKNH
jgi:hypothetical protein